jgi:hypothetical protein
LRIGTWNLRECPSPTSARGAAIAAWLGAQCVDVWLLTEVHAEWSGPGGPVVVSPPRGSSQPARRWSGIQTQLPVERLAGRSADAHSGEEGLALARLYPPGRSSVLVACSVLPWVGARPHWPGLPAGHEGAFRFVLDHHAARIGIARRPGEPLIWGGDFNQQLTPPYAMTGPATAAAVRAAFDAAGVVPLTVHADHLDQALAAIDHLAVTPDLLAGSPAVAVHRPEVGYRIDHAAYTTELD